MIMFFNFHQLALRLFCLLFSLDLVSVFDQSDTTIYGGYFFFHLLQKLSESVILFYWARYVLPCN